MRRCPVSGSKETVVGRVTCEMCGGSGKLPVFGLDPVRVEGEAPCPCAVELLWDGRTLWVNETAGGSIARFGPAGIDIHRSTLEQVKGGHQCLHCVPATMEEVADRKARGSNHRLWGEFVEALKRHHGVEIPEGFA